MRTPFYNAHHSPIGAFASFTLGYPGASGGFGLELDKPANQNVFIGLQNRNGDGYRALPFYADGIVSDRLRFTDEAAERPTLVAPFEASEVQRELGLTTDTWHAPDMTLRILSPVRAIPDPATATPAELASVLLPAVFAELTVDNRQGTHPRRAFFGYQGNDSYSAMRRLEDSTTASRVVGVGQGRLTALASPDAVVAALAFTLEDALYIDRPENLDFGLGRCGFLLFDTPPGEQRTFRVALCFHRTGIVTANLETAYLYNRYFPTLESVAAFVVEQFDSLVAACVKDEDRFDLARLSPTQRQMLCLAVRSYYNSTELLDQAGAPLWVVNEGEFRMMNTLDLSVDHLFLEMKLKPWMVRNALDRFADRYSYTDSLRLPGSAQEYPGGISFTHDMGVGNVFAPPGRSAYEMAGLTDCFSYMTHEQLVNWLLCALVYVAQTEDATWGERRMATIRACFENLLNRDHPQAVLRDGLMNADSSRTAGGAEIATYDYLDGAIGQARRNTYIGGKCWAVYVALEAFFTKYGQPDLAVQAGDQAERCARTIAAAMTESGIPAVLEGENPTRIIPVIEGLAFAPLLGIGSAFDPGAWRKSLNLHHIHKSSATARTVSYIAHQGLEPNYCQGRAHRGWQGES